MLPILSDFPLPFVVPLHDRMWVRSTRDGKTVLTLEQMIYTWRVCDYTAPLSYGNYWCFETMEDAVGGLWCYLLGLTDEPEGWTKAVTRDESDERMFKTRRKINGEIVEGEEEEYA